VTSILTLPIVEHSSSRSVGEARHMKMKRTQKLRAKRESGKRPREREQPLRSRKTIEIDLPPNEEIRKFPDEIYGDTEIPHRKNHE
jgi:hypothetical protein